MAACASFVRRDKAARYGIQSITLVAIGLIERDGAFILAGIAAAIGAAILVVTIYWTLIALAMGQITAWLAP